MSVLLIHANGTTLISQVPVTATIPYLLPYILNISFGVTSLHPTVLPKISTFYSSHPEKLSTADTEVTNTQQDRQVPLAVHSKSL